jgi:hypothetical protein
MEKDPFAAGKAPTGDRWTRLDTALADALELPSAERLDWLRARLAGDAELLAEAERLLGKAAEADAFFERSSVAGLRPGSRIGAWTLERELGRGGSGVVWLAHRTDRKTTMRAAIKLLHVPFASAALLDRFEREKQILASLQHPHIAHLVDAGIGPEDLPSFALEYIDGSPLPEHCEANQLPLAQRVRLGRQVLDGLQYAHSKLVVHRDLKPGNILCTESGIPKILDFGIARLLDEGEGQPRTETLYRALSVDYASPEQLRGEEVSTAADIFSMGLVLYEAFTGERARRWTQRSIVEILRECEGFRLPAHPALPADLRAILWKATEADVHRRYASASEFRADLGRFLDGLPVAARPASFGYVAKRYLRRHALATAAAAAALAAVLVGSSIALYQAREADRQRLLALDRQRQAEAAAAEALEAKARTQEALQRAEQLRVLSENRREDLLRLSYSFVGDAYQDISRLPGATPVRARLLEQAIGHLDKLEATTPGDEGLLAVLVDALGNLADTYWSQNSNLGERQKALALLQRRGDLIERLGRIRPGSPVVERLRLDHAIREAILPTVADQAQQELRRQRLAVLEPRVRRLLASAPRSRELYRFGVVYYFQRAVYLESAPERFPYYRRMLELAEEDERGFGGDESCWRSAALAHKYLAGSMSVGEPEHRRHAQAAVEYDEKRVALNPMNATARMDLSFSWTTLAASLEAEGRRAEAAQRYREVYQQRLGLLQVDPGNQWYQRSLWYPLVRATSLSRQSADGEGVRTGLAELKRISSRYETPASAAATIAALEGDLLMAENTAGACDAFRQAQRAHEAGDAIEKQRFLLTEMVASRLKECEQLAANGQ